MSSRFRIGGVSRQGRAPAAAAWVIFPTVFALLWALKDTVLSHGEDLLGFAAARSNKILADSGRHVHVRNIGCIRQESRIPRASSPNDGEAGTIEIVTETFLEGAKPKELVELLGTADNWPDIVMSSWEVRGKSYRIMNVGDTVEEYFGVPYIWFPSVNWTCVQADLPGGIIDVQSADGVPGLAADARMLFQISGVGATAEQGAGTKVRLAMSYRPLNPLASMARPALEVDNTVALKWLLPMKLARERERKKAMARPTMGWQYDSTRAIERDVIRFSKRLLRPPSVANFPQVSDEEPEAATAPKESDKKSSGL
eukprot:TRINITY_DN80655_c0_g1_i1.p1 TRINITY_DN80655_c0_g1~~TRINITY_DN80655_c0_g1_i1.p1  ORF type:complete len:313 (+),score=43.10 TRINITY_DN80655_c0_g1_i1:60-998(+)